MSSWPLRGFRVVSIVNTIKRKKKLGKGFMFGQGKFIETHSTFDIHLFGAH